MIIRPHGETNITLTCQNRCVGCNHFIPMQEPWFINYADFERDISTVAKIVHFGVYNLVGGEPLLHPDILKLIEIEKNAEIADWYEITSNGQAIKKMPDKFFEMINELIITPYKLDAETIQYIKDKCAQFGTQLQFHPVIFTECAYKQPSDECTASNRYRQCWYNINRHVIDGGYFYRCCTAPFIPSVLLGQPKETDGIALKGLTEERLEEYLMQADTPQSCYVCASNCGRRIEWRETGRDKWLEESVR